MDICIELFRLMSFLFGSFPDSYSYLLIHDQSAIVNKNYQEPSNTFGVNEECVSNYCIYFTHYGQNVLEIDINKNQRNKTQWTSRRSNQRLGTFVP